MAAHLLLPDIALVDLDKEHTLPAWFSALQLAGIGGTCLFAFEAERRDVGSPQWSTWIWPVVGLGFFYLSADEALALHERVLTHAVRAFFPADSLLQGVLPWQLIFAPGIVAAFVVIVSLLQTRLGPLPGAKGLGLAGLGLWTASFILEGAAKPYFIPAGLYRIEVALEEACEMVGGTCILAAFACFAIARVRQALPLSRLSVWRVLGAAGGLAAVAAVAIGLLTLSNPVYLHRRAGDKFVDNKQYDRALIAYAEAATLRPEDAEIWRRMGRAALRARDREKAIEAFTRAAALEPQDEKVQNDLGVALHHAGKLDEAERAYQRAIAISPDYARPHKNLGVLYERLGDRARAEAAYRRALDQNQAMADVHRYLGNLLRQEGRLVEAREHWQQSLALEPEQRDAKVLLRRIRAAGDAG